MRQSLFFFAFFAFSISALGDISSVSSAFTPADGSRSYMDIGGVWSGTADVTATIGDSFSFEFTNSDDDAFDLTSFVDLPAEFTYVVGTAAISLTGAGCGAAPAITATQIGTNLDFDLSSYDLPADCTATVTYGLTTTNSASPSVHTIISGVTYADTEGGAQGATVDTDLNVTVREGLTTIVKTPLSQTRAVGDTAAFTVSVCNSGVGGLFDVEIDESSISPINAAGSLELSTMTQSAPALPLATGVAPILTLPYLAPGICFDVAVNAAVRGCTGIDNIAATDDRTNSTTGSVSANVKLDFTTPLIGYALPVIAVPAVGTANISFSINNTGLGDAKSLVLTMAGLSANVIVSNVSPLWTWNAGLKTFTALTDLENGTSRTLSFDVEKVQVCPPAPDESGNYTLSSSYTDTCGNPFSVPVELGSYTIATVGESVTLSKVGTGSAGASNIFRINVGESGTYTVGLAPGLVADFAELNTDPIVVTDVLPSGPTGYSLGSAPAGTTLSCSGSCGAGDTITWTVPQAALVGPLTFDITFNVPNDPCLAGTSIANTVNTTYDYTGGSCVVNPTETSRFYITNTPGATGSSTQSYNVDDGGGGTGFEAGLNDDGDLVEEHNLGEGDHIYFENTISFSGGFVGEWIGSEYRDNTGGLSAVGLVTGSLEATSIDFVGASTQAIPSGSISFSPGNLVIDLDFLQGASFFNDNDVDGKTLELRYAITVQNSEILPEQVATIVSQGQYEIANTAGGAGCGVGSNETFTQAVGFEIFRREAAASVSVPSIIEVCGPFSASVTAAKDSDAQFHGWNAQLVLDELTYSYEHPQTPAYSGFFTPGNITYTDNGGVNPEWQSGPIPLEQTSDGVVTFNAVLPATSPTTPAPFAVTLNYDDTQTVAAGSPGLQYTDSANDSPIVVKEGNLAITTTPTLITVLEDKVQFSIYVTNGGAGTAFNASLTEVFPTTFTPNAADTNALNPGFSVTVVGQQMDWSLGDMFPGQTLEIKVVADVSGSACTLPPLSNSIEARWGCGGSFVAHQTVSSSLPNFEFPSGKLQVFHDVASSQVAMCDSDNLGLDVITIRNAGVATIYNAYIEEVLDPAVTGIDLAAGAIEYSVDGGAWLAAPAPLGAGTPGSPYRWDDTILSALDELAPNGQPGSTVSIRFPINATELVNSATPSIAVNGGGGLSCGDPVSTPDPGPNFNLKVLKPDMRLLKTGRNITTGTGFSETVHGKPGDVVEWRIEVQNNGTYTSKTLELTDDFPNTGGGAGTLTGPGHAGTSFPDAATENLPDINASSSAVYTLQQTLGATCVDAVNTASVEWGCTGPATLSTPTDNSDTANLVMDGDFSGGVTQTFTTLTNGRTNIQIEVENSGAFVQNLSLTDTLPAGFDIDTSFSPTVTSTGSVSAVSLSGTATIPIFTFTGTLENSTALTLNFRIYQNANFDAIRDDLINPETIANTLDPTLPSTNNNDVTFNFENGCGTVDSVSDSSSMDAKTPDLDIAVSPTSQVVTAGNPYTFTFTITNNGDATSIADALTFTPTIGAGWTATSVTVTTPGVGGSGGACGATCSPVQLGTLAQGASAAIEVQGTANNNGSVLEIVGLIQNELLRDDGTGTGSNLSNDSARPKVVGYYQGKTLDSTSEAFTALAVIAVGEEATFNLTSGWYGLSSGETITNVVVRDSLPIGLGYVSHADQAGHDVVYTFGGPPPVTSGVVNYSAVTISDPGGTFDVNLVSRVLNVGSAQSASLTNNFGISFDYLSQTFASDNAADGFGGGTEPDLHTDVDLTVNLPVPTFVKEVRNVTQSTAFGSSTAAVASDELEYRITIGNTGLAPIFDIVVNDILDGKLNLIDSAADGINNDTNGFPEGTFIAGLGGTILFNHANTLLVSGSSLERLDPSNTIEFLYRATVDGTANPSETLTNNATFTANSLPGASGNQTAPVGTSGDADGEETFSLSDTADAIVEDVGFTKIVNTSSVGADTSLNVVVGEQIEFALDIILPSSTLPSFNIDDDVPAGMKLVATPTVNVNSTTCSAPTITPVAPSSGAFTLNFDFGNCTVPSGLTEAQRTVSVRYTLQVENVATNTNGSNLVNRARYSFTGYTSADSQVTLTVQEPNISVFTKVAAPDSDVDAGDEVTYTITITNTGPVTAHDIKLEDTLPADVVYKAASTLSISGPAITEPDVASGVLTWGRTQAVPQTFDLGTGQTMSYSYVVTLQNTIEPEESLSNSIVIDYTSLFGAPGPNLGAAVGAAGGTDGERTGSGVGDNTYTSTATDIIQTADNFTITKVASGDTLTPDGFRVGDLITYTVEVALQEGTVDGFELKDTLPTGLEFFDRVSLLPASSSGAGSINYTDPGDPTVGATALSWNFGTIVIDGDNNAANNTLTLVYRAVVGDTGGVANTPATQNLTNLANFDYQLEDASVSNSGNASDAIDVKQPIVVVAKTLTGAQPSVVGSGDTINFTLTITNSGSAPSYNTSIIDTLPAEMRDTAPTVVSATLNGAVFALGAPTWNPGTGEATWSLADGDSIDSGSQTWVINYQATVDSDVGAGQSFSNSASVGTYCSLPSATTSLDRRCYPSSATSSQALTTPAPSDMGKTVDVTEANIGDTITYTLRVPQTAVAVVLYDINILDNLPAGLRITNVSHNGVALGVGVTDSSTTTNVDLDFDTIPKSQQAVVTVEAVVENVIGNQAPNALNNTATYTWAGTDGGVAEPSISSPMRAVTTTEPAISFTKILKTATPSDPSVGLQAGDNIVYTITVNNTGTGDAHDLTIVDIADDNLLSPTVSANPDNPGAATNTGSAGGFTNWSWTVAGPLVKTTGVYQFDVQFTLGPDTEPYMNIGNRGTAACTSTVGINADERSGADGSSGLNDYFDEQSVPVVVQTGNIKLNKRIKAPVVTTYDVGDSVSFEIVAEFGSGNIDDFHLFDVLPTGMNFVSSSLTVSNMQVQGGGAISVVSGPTAGDTGTLDFELGNIESSGANPSIILEVVARVQDVPANVDGTTLLNDADASLEDPDDGSIVNIDSASTASVEVIEPNLLLSLDGPANVDVGVAGDFSVIILNNARGTAYQPKIEIEIPADMRAQDPSLLTTTVNISGGRTLTLAVGTDYTVSYTAGTGRLVYTLISVQAFIAQNETVTIAYKSVVDSGISTSTGTAYQMIASVSEFGSRDSSAGGVVENRLDTTVFNSGTLGTANAAVGDDHHDDHEFDIRAPQLVITKAVNTTSVTPGDSLTYIVSLVNTGAVDAVVNTVTDDLASFFEAGTLVTPVVAGATPGSITFDAAGGTNSTGTWTVTGLTIPNTGAAVTITFTADTQRPLPSGTQIFNQAVADVEGYDDDFISDSTNASDDDGVETGNDASDADDDDPTLATVSSAPNVIIQKNSVVADPPLMPGGEITYTITISNTGDENLTSALVQDTIPANTTYVLGSTMLDPNGTPTAIPDVGGTSALVAGFDIDATSPGVLEVDETIEYSFKVTVDAGVTNGTVITNQAFVNGEGDGSGPIPPIPSDDPDTGFGPDPTQNTVGSAPAIYATKTVSDLNGGSLIDGETLRYTIVVRNNGSTDITNVDFTDAIPANTTYTAASIQYDDDNLGPNPAVSFTDATDGDAGEFNGTAVKIVLGTLVASGEAKIEFDVVVDGGTSAGTLISNQGTFTGDGVPDTNTDFDSNPSNGDQPTDIVVGNAPVLRMTKEVSDLNGGLVEVGDELLYTIRVLNIGTLAANGIVITDPMPTPVSVTYVPSTTELNSVAQVDSGGLSPLVAGLNIGSVAAGGNSVITYRVQIPPAEAVGTIIENQASFTSADAGSGVSDSDRDDGIENGNDAADPNDDDPTQIQIGGAPGIAAVSGFVWRDLNHDRVIDSGEPREENWTVDVLLGGLVVGAATTDANGLWQINGLAPGPGYEIQFRHPTNGTVYGGARSSEPGVDLSFGTIKNLTLPPGLTILEQNLPLDPSGVVYDAVSRLPVSNAIADISGPPGFDPSLHLLPGQESQVTASDGFYRFDLLPTAPVGDYTLAITVPPGYLPGLSSLILPEASVCDPLSPVCNPGALDPFTVLPGNVAPTVGSATTYYMTFTLDASNPATPDVVNNHIPVDPILQGAILVTKTASEKNISIGQFSNYTIRVENTLNVSLGNLDVEDILPPGFTYVEGSALVDGAPLEPTQVDRQLTWTNQTFAAKEIRSYQIATIVGAGVRQGSYCNLAQVRQNIVDQVITDRAKACVRVIPDSVFDCPDLIGKVFDDRNKNGYQDKGEVGIPGVKLITTKGWIVSADQFGRYHIACPIIPNVDRGSNFAVKVDSSTLPTGYRLTSENPRVVRLTRGKLTKANFGASIHRVLGIDITDEAFVNGKLDEKWAKSIPDLARIILETDSVVRITYNTKAMGKVKEAKRKVEMIKSLISQECRKKKHKKKILFEDFIYRGGVNEAK